MPHRIRFGGNLHEETNAASRSGLSELFQTSPETYKSVTSSLRWAGFDCSPAAGKRVACGSAVDRPVRRKLELT
jgi:hypothetical protein